ERACAAVRLLHAGPHDHRRRLPRAEPVPERRADPPRHRRKSLPLHGLSQHRERDPRGVRGNAPDRRREAEGRRRGEGMTATVAPKYIGTRVPRKEDPRLITGEGTFTDDVVLPGMSYLTLVRIPNAHARIRRLD